MGKLFSKVGDKMEFIITRLRFTDKHLRGHSNTHIANGSSVKIFANVTDHKVEHIEPAVPDETVNTINSSVSTNCAITLDDLLRDGYAVISPGKYLPFPSENPHVSIFTEGGRGVCKNYRIARDTSVIVKADETVTVTRYGRLWVDVDGVCHLPQQHTDGSVSDGGL